MGYNNPDLYYQPEKFGLTEVGELNDPDASYSFNDFVVWQHEDGSFYFAEDVGCSCPSPFEDFTSLETATKVETIDQFERAVRSYFSGIAPYRSDYSERLYWDDDELPSRFQTLKAEAIDLIRKVEQGL